MSCVLRRLMDKILRPILSLRTVGHYVTENALGSGMRRNPEVLSHRVSFEKFNSIIVNRFNLEVNTLSHDFWK